MLRLKRELAELVVVFVAVGLGHEAVEAIEDRHVAHLAAFAAGVAAVVVSALLGLASPGSMRPSWRGIAASSLVVALLLAGLLVLVGPTLEYEWLRAMVFLLAGAFAAMAVLRVA